MTYLQAVTVYPASLSSLDYVLTAHHVYFLVSFFLHLHGMWTLNCIPRENLQLWHLILRVHFTLCFSWRGLIKTVFKEEMALLLCHPL